MKTHVSDITLKDLLPGIKGRFFHTEKTTIGFVELEANAVLSEHAHIHEQTTYVTEGKLELIIDGMSHILEAVMIINIPSNAIHSAKALTFCRVIDTFSPVRDDYK